MFADVQMRRALGYALAWLLATASAGGVVTLLFTSLVKSAYAPATGVAAARAAPPAKASPEPSATNSPAPRAASPTCPSNVTARRPSNDDDDYDDDDDGGALPASTVRTVSVRGGHASLRFGWNTVCLESAAPVPGFVARVDQERRERLVVQFVSAEHRSTVTATAAWPPSVETVETSP